MSRTTAPLSDWACRSAKPTDRAYKLFDGDGLYLINLHGQTYVKRLQVLRDGLHVISTNKRYLSEVVPPNEADQLHIGGRVLGLALMRSAEEV